MMKPDRLPAFLEKNGKLETHRAGQVFHAQDFPDTLFMLKSGYVKRYQVTKADERVIELIYGPSHIFPLSQLYKRVFDVEQNQEDLVYVYQAMSDIKILSIGVDEVLSELEKQPMLYHDLYYESGLRLKSNINRLASNALRDDYKKVAHLLVCLADEFGELKEEKGKPAVKISVPLKPIDMAEQLNISVQVADAIMNSLKKSGLVTIDGSTIRITHLDLLKDTYL